MLQSWLSGLNKLCERGIGRLTFSSKHQCVCGLSPGLATATATRAVPHARAAGRL